MNKKTIIIVLIIVIIVVIIRSFFIIDIRYFKEEFLIKNNYKRNFEQFNAVKENFKSFPTITVNFNFDSYIDISFEREFVNKNNEPTFTYDYQIPDIIINDTIAYARIQNTSYAIQDFNLNDSILKVILSDSIIEVNTNKFTLHYSGNMESIHFKKILKLSELDLTKIEGIKDELRKVNCFGYSKFGSGEYILNYRTDQINSLSYLLAQNIIILERIDDYLGSYGQIETDIYWIQIGNQLVDYIPYLKLKNRKI